MSATHQFVLWAPYSTAPDMLERWNATHVAHIANLKPHVATGAIKSGGPVFSARADLTAPDAEKEKFGSLLIFQGESIEEVRKIVEADPFYTGGVWDKEKLALHPFKAVV